MFVHSLKTVPKTVIMQTFLLFSSRETFLHMYISGESIRQVLSRQHSFGLDSSKYKQFKFSETFVGNKFIDKVHILVSLCGGWIKHYQCTYWIISGANHSKNNDIGPCYLRLS